MGNISGFGIGTYQSLTGGTTIGTGYPIAPALVVSPYANTYGGTYGYVIDTTIRAPSQVQLTPAPEVGLDGAGKSVVRGFPSLIWSYNTLRPDYWYYLMHLYKQAGACPPGFQYLVLLQYPDATHGGMIVQNLARMEPPTFSSPRDIGSFHAVQLIFTCIGQAQLNVGTPIRVIS